MEGKKGNALSLNGSNYYVQEAYDLIEFGDKSFTIEFWMNSKDDAAYILNKGAIASSNGGNWVGLEYKSGALRFAVDDDVVKSEVQWAEGSTIFDGEWHHVVLARDVVAKKLLMYVDGELKTARTTRPVRSTATARHLSSATSTLTSTTTSPACSTNCQSIAA